MLESDRDEGEGEAIAELKSPMRGQHDGNDSTGNVTAPIYTGGRVCGRSEGRE